ncbi:MAG: hypothetical protein WC401_11750 [Bacteroidales bacterium]|jgi:hypothetical protein
MGLTDEIKYLLLQQYGFKKGFFVCTELSYSLGISDVFCISKNIEKKDIIDIEVKVSKSDFLNDFRNKDIKHFTFRNLILNKTHSYSRYPSKFYFCVPEEITEYCLSYINKNRLSYYGLIQYKPVFYKSYNEKYLNVDSCLSVVKKAKRFNDITENDYNFFKDLMIRRLTNDCIGFNKTKAFLCGRYEKIKEIK